MTVLLVGIVEGVVPELPVGALGEPKVHRLDGGEEISAVVVESDIDWSQSPQDDIEWLAPRVVHFDDVLRACVASNVIPIRFGVAFRTPDAAASALADVNDVLRSELDRLRTVDEYRVRVREHRRSIEAESGTDYLRRRREARSRSLDGDLAEVLAAEGVDHQIVEVSTEAVSAAVLASMESWARVTEAMSERFDRVEVEGPLPPYHFTDVSIGAA